LAFNVIAEFMVILINNNLNFFTKEAIVEKVVTLAMVVFLGTSISVWYSLYNQEWATSKHQQYTSILLSPAVLIITWAISNNLALSLGMIGALSIVRFRNPVKSPAELSVYFVYIVIGVSAGVNYKYAISIWVIALVAPLIVSVLNKIKPIRKAAESSSKGLIAHFQFEEHLKKTIDTIELDKDKIISIHENASGTKPQTHISIMVDSQTEFISIAEEFKNCGNLSSSNLQQSF